MDEKNTAKTVSLGEIFASLKAHLIFIIVFTLAISVIGAIYAFAFKKTTYTASATLQVYVQPTEDNKISETTAYSFGTYLADDYMKVLKYPEYIKKAAEKGVKINASGLKFDHPEKSVLLEVSYTVKSKKDVREKTANELNNYLKYTKEAIDAGENSNYAGRLRIESYASPDTVSASRGAGTTIIIAFILGLVISVAIIVIKYLVDDTFKSKEDVESVTGATVLTVIGLIGDDGRKSKQGAKGGAENV